jgi:2-hydroxy-3-keto-5-methylthiopentenyl-1-phosphate phosphatase
MHQKNFKIFIDFDGTITKKDVGEGIFRKFGKPEVVSKVIEELLSDKISSRKCWELLCESAGEINQHELDKYIDEFEIEEDFASFIEFSKENNFDVFILSDGFDYYLKKILERENLEDLKFFANALEIVDRKLKPNFPHFSPDFASSANCKRDHILNNSSDDDYTVFIGDGNSDKDSVLYSDFIFAKNDLLKFCEVERITFFPFKNFNEIQDRLIQLLNKKKLKKRHQSQLKRREAYITEH